MEDNMRTQDTESTYLTETPAGVLMECTNLQRDLKANKARIHEFHGLAEAAVTIGREQEARLADRNHDYQQLAEKYEQLEEEKTQLGETLHSMQQELTKLKRDVEVKDAQLVAWDLYYARHLDQKERETKPFDQAG